MIEKSLKNIISKKSIELGFDKIGFADPKEDIDPNEYLDKWIESKYQ